MEDWEYINDPPRPTFAKVQVLIACGQTDFTRANLIGLDLSDLCLDDLDFTEANLTGATIREIRNSNLTRANLTNANLVTADLTGANLTDTILNGANLRKATLRDVNFSTVRLRDVNLAFADLRGAKNINIAGTRANDFADIFFYQTYLPNGMLFPGPLLATGYVEDFPKEFR
jgi:uncharacterized protein YjbI with pentapeptide repeats